MYTLIQKKRDGIELTDEEIRYIINKYTSGNIPDYQMSAFLMAVFFRGMNERETAALTDAMAKSGDCADLSAFGNKSVDKHSTGGVGDKTSLITLPIAASLGCKVAKMSGRGLGYTGGTADKLESIKGYKTTLSQKEFIKQTEKVGIAVIGHSGNLSPADKKIYALRDVTATVESIPLIASSIMSKKIAAGAKNIVLDVKCGSGAFMKTAEDAEKLAMSMVEIGRRADRNVRALITDMDKPLGRAVGNTLEVKEAIEVLCGGGDEDLKEICCALASEMVSMVLEKSREESNALVYDALSSGKAYAKFKEWITAQGGDAEWIENTKLFPKAKYSSTVYARSEGYIYHINTRRIGETCVILGGGRMTKEDTIDFAAGVILNKKAGDYVKCGDKLAELYTNNKESLEKAMRIAEEAIEVSKRIPSKNPMIYKIIE